MNNKSRRGKLYYILYAAIFVAFIHSCDVFPQNDDFLNTLKDQVTEANASEVQVFIQSASGTGNVTPSGEQTMKVDIPFNLNFQVDDDYSFTHWAAFDRSDDTTELLGIISFDPAGSITTRAKLLTSQGNILIIPVSAERGYITEKTPFASATAVSNTLPIEVVFSKPIDIASFYFTNEEAEELLGGAINDSNVKRDGSNIIRVIVSPSEHYLKNIEIFNRGNDNNYTNFISSYGDPVLSENKQTLSMTTTLADGIKQIRISFLDDIFDTDKITIRDIDAHEWSYKTSGKGDNDPPIFTPADTYATKTNKDGEFKFIQGNPLTTLGIGQNRVENSVYIFIVASDVGGTIEEYTIKMRQTHNNSGVAASGVETTKAFGDNEFPQNLSDYADGIINIELGLEDNSGNVSDVPVYYNIIKDTTAPVPPGTNNATITKVITGGSNDWLNKYSSLIFTDDGLVDVGFAGSESVPRTRSDSLEWNFSFGNASNFRGWSNIDNAYTLATNELSSVLSGVDNKNYPVYVKLRDDLENESDPSHFYTFKKDIKAPVVTNNNGKGELRVRSKSRAVTPEFYAREKDEIVLTIVANDGSDSDRSEISAYSVVLTIGDSDEIGNATSGWTDGVYTYTVPSGKSGIVSYSGTVTDVAGNITAFSDSTDGNDDVLVDTTPPAKPELNANIRLAAIIDGGIIYPATIQEAYPDTTYFYNETAGGIKFTFTPPTGTDVVGYVAKTTGIPTEEERKAAKAANPKTVTLIGTQTWYVYAIDTALNASVDALELKVAQDKSVPNRPGTITINEAEKGTGDRNYVKAEAITVKIPTVNDTGSGVATYQITASNSPPTATNWISWTGDSELSSAGHTLTSIEDEKDVYVWVKDNVNNISQSSSTAVTLDKTKPTVSANFTSSNRDKLYAKKDDIITLNVTASDAGSGLPVYVTPKIRIAETSYDMRETGENIFTYSVPANRTGPVAISVTVADHVSNSTTVDASEGTAGIASLTVDTTDPVIGITTIEHERKFVPQSRMGGSLMNSSDKFIRAGDTIILTVNATDANGSGINNSDAYSATMMIDGTSLSGSGTWSGNKYTYTVTGTKVGDISYDVTVADNAGNTDSSMPNDQIIKLDTSMPSTPTFNSLVGVGDSADKTHISTGSVYYYAGTDGITFTFTAEDESGDVKSGIKGYVAKSSSITIPLTKSELEAASDKLSRKAGAYDVYAVDNAYNASKALKIDVRSDNTEPVPAITYANDTTNKHDGQSYAKAGENITLTIDATDTGGSGIADTNEYTATITIGGTSKIITQEKSVESYTHTVADGENGQFKISNFTIADNVKNTYNDEPSIESASIIVDTIKPVIDREENNIDGIYNKDTTVYYNPTTYKDRSLTVTDTNGIKGFSRFSDGSDTLDSLTHGQAASTASSGTVYAVDKAGNISEGLTVTADSTAPPRPNVTIVEEAGTVKVSSNVYTKNDSVKLAISAVTDARSGVHSYRSNGVTWITWDGSALDGSSAYATSGNLSGDGTKTIDVHVRDNVGNYNTTPKEVYVIKDTTPPDAPTAAIRNKISVGSSSKYVKNKNISVSLSDLTDPVISSTIDGSGVTEYQITTENTKPTLDLGTWITTTSYDSNVSYTFPDEEDGSFKDGSKTIYVWLRDAVGNISVAGQDTVKVDTTKPTATAILSVNSKTANTDGNFYAKEGDVITLTIDATDGTGSGIDPDTYSATMMIGSSEVDIIQSNSTKNRFTYIVSGNKNGAVVISNVRVEDKVGHSYTLVDTDITGKAVVDTKAPTGSAIFVSSNTSDSAFAKADDIITLTVDETEINIATYSTPRISINSVNEDSMSVDDANANKFTYTVPVNINGTVSITNVIVTDKAGNTGDMTVSGDVTVDTKAPTGTATFVSSNSNKAFAKVGNTIKLTVTATDVGSGIKTYNNPAITIGGVDAKGTGSWSSNVYTYAVNAGENGVVAITNVTVTDNVGNTSAAGAMPATASDGTNKIDSITVDTADPAISEAKISIVRRPVWSRTAPAFQPENYAGTGDTIKLTVTATDPIANSVSSGIDTSKYAGTISINGSSVSGTWAENVLTYEVKAGKGGNVTYFTDLKVTDNAGNQSEAFAATVPEHGADTEQPATPTISEIVAGGGNQIHPAGTAETKYYYSGSEGISFTFNAIDTGGSGIKGYVVKSSIDGVPNESDRKGARNNHTLMNGTYYVSAVDNALNVSANALELEVVQDIDKPTGSATYVSSNSNKAYAKADDTITLTVDAEDVGSGVNASTYTAKIKIGGGGEQTIASTNGSFIYTVAEGENGIVAISNVTVTDNVGNTSESMPATASDGNNVITSITVDTTKPIIDEIADIVGVYKKTVVNPITYYYSNAVNTSAGDTTLIAIDTNGIKGFSKNNNSTVVASTSDGIKLSDAIGTVHAVDNAGNVSESGVTVQADATVTAPATVTIKGKTSGFIGTTAIKVDISAVTDGGSGVKEYKITNTNASTDTGTGWIIWDGSVKTDASHDLASGDNAKTIYVWVKDNVGNISTGETATVTLDTTAPTGTATITSDGVIAVSTITLTVTATDTGSGIASYSAPTLTIGGANRVWTGTTDGIFTYTIATDDVGAVSIGTVTVTDTVGNPSGAIIPSGSVTVDAVAPTVTGGTVNGSVINANAVALTAAAGDFPVVITSAETNATYAVTKTNAVPTAWVANSISHSFIVDANNIWLWIKDAAGNVSPVFPVIVTVTATP